MDCDANSWRKPGSATGDLRFVARKWRTTAFVAILCAAIVPAATPSAVVAEDDSTAGKPLLLFETTNSDDSDDPVLEERQELRQAPVRSSYAAPVEGENDSLIDPEELLPSAKEMTEKVAEKPAAKVEEKATADAKEAAPQAEAAAPAPYTREIEYVYATDDPGLFPNLRPFKRARTRIFGVQSAPPAPPATEQLAPAPVEQSAEQPVVTEAKPPVLSKEAEELPPLDLETAKAVDPTTSAHATKEELAALREEAKSMVWKKGDLKITPYGFLNLAVSYDTKRAVPGEYILYLQDPDVDSSSGFGVDARTSRVGMKIEGPRIEALNATLGGLAEVDFQGTPAGSKNKGGLQLRRAYAELVDKQHDRRLLAGQDWEIISPGAPQMLNYLPGAFAGNIQYRRAQLRFEQGWTSSPDLYFLGQIGIFDDVLGDYTSTAGVSPAAAGWPVIEGRISAQLFKESRCGLPITVGLSGHIGEQYYNFSPIAGTMASTAERKAIETWSANFDVDIPITKQFKLQGEYYQGANLSSFCGAINQGVDLYYREAIHDRGWWAAAHFDMTKQLATNVGYGIDKPKGSDLAGTSLTSSGIASARTKNQIYFTNVIYNWTANFMTGVEVSYWETGYRKSDVSSDSPTTVSEKVAKSVRTEFVTRLTF